MKKWYELTGEQFKREKPRPLPPGFTDLSLDDPRRYERVVTSLLKRLDPDKPSIHTVKQLSCRLVERSRELRKEPATLLMFAERAITLRESPDDPLLMFEDLPIKASPEPRASDK